MLFALCVFRKRLIAQEGVLVKVGEKYKKGKINHRDTEKHRENIHHGETRRVKRKDLTVDLRRLVGPPGS
jgi:hypothetical protein